MTESHIQAQSFSLEGYFNSGRFQPADIQRDYQWTQEQVGRLVEDVVTHAANNPHQPYFMGAVVGISQNNTFHIYDGLQRTTTLTLFLSMLRDRVEDPTLKQRLNAAINVDGQGRLWLFPPDETLAECFQPEGATLKGVRGGFYGRRIALRRNRATALRHIKPLTQEQLENVARVLLDKVVLVVIGLDNKDLAEKVFETINMTGLSVSSEDLVKSRLSQFATSDADAQDLVNKWERTRQKVRADFPGFLSAMIDHMLDFPDTRRISANDHLTQWMARSQNDASNPNAEFVNHCLARTLSWNRVDETYNYARPGVKAMKPLLPVHPFDWHEWKVIAIEIDYALMNKQVELVWAQEQYDLLQRRCMALTLSNLSEQSRRSVFRMAWMQLRNGENIFTGKGALAFGHPEHRRRLRQSLMAPMMDYSKRRILLKWLEAQGGREDLFVYRFAGGDKSSHVDQVEVEHVLPGQVAQTSPWRKDFPDDQSLVDYANKLGNLILVPSSVNNQLSRHPFEQKRAILQNSGLDWFTLASAVTAEARWDKETIDRRTEILSERIWSEFRFDNDDGFSHTVH